MILGVDPGISGALAMLEDDGSLINLRDMPADDGVVLGARVAMFAGPRSPGHVAVIERVHSMPGQGVASTFKFGRSLGVVEGALTAMGWPVKWVTPAKWKRDLGLPADKGASRRMAAELWPDDARAFARVKDDGRAEAALIAYWWLTKGAA